MTRMLMPLLRRVPAALVLASLGPATPAGAQVAEPITLERAIALARERSPGAKAATSSRDEARWRAREFDARLLPQLKLSGQMPSFFRRIDQVTQPDGTVRFVGRSQIQSSMTLNMQQQVPFTGGQLYFSSSLTRTADETDTRFWSSSPAVVGIQQQLFRINPLAWDARAQTLNNSIAERQYLEQMEDVAGQTVSAFFDVFRAQMSLQNARNNIVVNDTLYRINKGRYEVGKIGEDDFLQSELALLRARAAAEDARIAFERALGALRIQLGLPTNADIEVVPPTGIPNVEVDTALAVRAALANGSPAVSRQLQILQADRGIREAKSSAGFGATITAEVGYNQTAPTFGGVYHAPLGQQQVTVGVDVPLMQWGAGKARVAAARAASDRERNAAHFAELQQAQDVSFAARELAQLQHQVELASKADTVAAKRFEVARNRYLIGKIDGTSLFTAQNEKNDALEAYVQSLGVYWAAYYKLRRLTLYDFAAGRPIASADAPNH